MNLPSSMPPAPHETQALQFVRDRMALAKALQQSGSKAKLEVTTLTDYRDALRALPAIALDAKPWATFLSNFQTSTNEAGMGREPNVQPENGTYLLAVLPTNLNGTVWTAEQIAAGQHFCFEGMSLLPGFTNLGDSFPGILPTDLVVAGTIVIQPTSSESRERYIIAQLQAAYQRIETLMHVKKI